MSIDINDARRFLQDTDKMASVAIEQPPLLPQTTSEKANTGDDKLDKLVRALQVILDTHEKLAQDAAVKCAGAFQDPLIRVTQFEYMFNKGIVEGMKKAMEIPAQIIVEKHG